VATPGPGPSSGIEGAGNRPSPTEDSLAEAAFAQGLVDTDTCPQAPARSAANTWALVGYFFEGCLAVWLFKARPAQRPQGGGAVPRMLETLGESWMEPVFHSAGGYC